MNDKLVRALKSSRKYFLIFGILWLILVIVFVAPLSCSIVEATAQGFGIETFLPSFGTNITNFFSTFGKAFSAEYIGTFGKWLLYFTLGYLVLVGISIIRTAPKHEYSNIEHGSSDWSENGEQYRVLSKKSGLILAENNYLPLNKMGNINVLIVGRIWIW